MERIYLNKDNVKVDMPVTYYAAPKSIGFDTQVISKPRLVGGEWVVNVAMIAQAVPVNKLVPMFTMHGDRWTCAECGVSDMVNISAMTEWSLNNNPNEVWMLCDDCGEKFKQKHGGGK